MATIGGVRPATIDAACTGALNADFVFQQYGVIAELKFLEEDPRDQRDYESKMVALHAKWARCDLVPPHRGDVLSFETTSLPPACQKEFLKFAGSRIKKHAIKANNQIKQTKITLDMPNAKGLFLLCNTGNTWLDPWAIGHLAWRAIGHSLSSINSLILFSFGIGHTAPGVTLPAEFWVPALRKNGSDVPAELLDRIRGAWMSKASKGQLVFEIQRDKDLLQGAKPPPRSKPMRL